MPCGFAGASLHFAGRQYEASGVTSTLCNMKKTTFFSVYFCTSIKKVFISRKSMFYPAESWFADADLLPLWIRSDEGQRTVSLKCIKYVGREM